MIKLYSDEYEVGSKAKNIKLFKTDLERLRECLDKIGIQNNAYDNQITLIGNEGHSTEILFDKGKFKIVK